MEELIDSALNITPATMAGYGLALVLALIAAAVWQKLYMKERQRSEDRATELKELHVESMSILAKVSQRLEDQHDMYGDIKAIKQHLFTQPK